MFTQQRQDAELKRLQRFKQVEPAPFAAMGKEIVSFFKQSVEKRQTKLGKIADAWTCLVPPLLLDHCALESLNRGTLTVLVDSSAHLYDLKQLLLAGLEKQLLLACKSAGLRKITLKPGRWYEGANLEDRKPSFGK
ncbi:MAG TPA: DciA family protein [Tepidisphaeraceae bacterium]|nr:DciA family protein [Tepidisphaeraceae bacterium]